MKHFHDYTILTTNIKGNELVETFGVDKGLITWAGVFFPPGCHGHVFAKILFQEHQILPRNQESWCHGNACWWDGELYFPVTAAPLKIKVIAYTPGANFDHTITVALELMPFSMVPQWDALVDLFTRIAKQIGVFIPKPQPEEMKPR